MIAARLLHALVASLLLAAGAACLAPMLRARRRPTRHLWAVALVLAAAWPLLQRAIDALLPDRATPLPVMGVQLLAPVVVAADGAARLTTDEILLALWLTISLLLLARLVVSVVRLARARAEWPAAELDGLAVRIAPYVGPAVVGFRRMEIVVPQWMLSLDPALRALALRHEEEHRRARDPLLLLASALVVALVPWNLPLWWIARRLRLAIELDCDARVLGHHPEATRYGRLLLLFAQRPGLATPLAPALTEPVTDLQRRIEAMSTRFTLSTKQRAALVASTAILVAAACSLRAPSNATNESPVRESDEIALRDGRVMSTAQTFFEFQVDKAVTPKSGNPAPRYPDAQRAANVEGEVLVQFVVDTAGNPEMSSFKVLKSNHENFTIAVRTVLADMHFNPAELRGRKVRQLVQMPFMFGLTKEAKVGPASVPQPKPSAERAAAFTQKAGYFEFKIEKAATPLAGNRAPIYPADLRASNVEGEVVAMFVVDTTGRADMRSFKVLTSNHDAFTAAVREALAEMRFSPAEVQGRKVRQVLKMPFVFGLSR